nr:unnamed protein product [Leishmania braziliensis]
MDRYEDSFESATTATDVEDGTTSVRTRSTTVTSGGSVDANNESGVDSSGDAISDGKGRSNELTSVSAAGFSPMPSYPVPPLPAAPVPVPVPVLSLIPSPASPLNGGSVDGLRASFTSPPDNAVVSEQPLEFGQCVTGGEAEGGRRDTSLTDSARIEPSTVYDASGVSRSEFAGTASDDADHGHQGPKGVGFETLSRFVAFRSRGSDGTTGPTSERRSSVIETAMSASSALLGGMLTAKRVTEGRGLRESDERWSTDDSIASQSTLAQPAELPQKVSPESKAASMTASSVFSTLSQHLQRQKPSRQRSQPAFLSAPATASAAVTSSVPMPAATIPETSYASTEGPMAAPVPLLTRQLLSPSQPPALAVSTSTPQDCASLPLPALPPPGWSSKIATNNSTTITTEAQQGWMIGDVQYLPSSTDKAAVQQIPPLPSPYEHHRHTTEQTRTSELREASEAVERLVKAFAMLKGYSRLEGAQIRSRTLADGVRTPVETATTVVASAHRLGSVSTVQVRDAVRPRGPRVFVPEVASAAIRASNSAVAASPQRVSASPQEERESVAEGVVLDCVLELLQEHTGRTASSSVGEHKGEGAKRTRQPTTSSWQGARPHYEVVTADAFVYGGGAMGHGRASHFAAGTTSAAPPSHVYFNPSSAFLGGLGRSGAPLFDPRDRQSAVDLYNVVREALDKYVLRRVVMGAGSAEEPQSRASRPRMLPITATFAWVLLLDMVSLCEEIARVAYDAAPCTPSAVYPVLAQFRGDAACEEVVKAAMHCLPFEALNTGDGDSSTPGDGGCIFRMACWVTKQQLWTIADALADTIREDAVRRAMAQQYSPFTAIPATEVDPRVLVPPTTPLLTLQPLPSRRGGGAVPMVGDAVEASATAASYSRVRRGGGGEGTGPGRRSADNELFEVPTAALQKVAYHISVLTTDLLSDMSTASHRALSALTAEEYPDIAAAVAETLSELLQDESIKAAVQRRAAEKVNKAQMARANFAGATRQRKEQAIIEKAEREAEEVVRHILQEVRTQGVA